MDGLQEKLDIATKDAWSTSVWKKVTPQPEDHATWAQLAPAFVGYDHTGNGFDDEDQLALLQRVLEADSYVIAVLGRPMATQIFNTYVSNRNRVMTRETRFDFEVFSESRINLQMLVPPLKLTNCPVYVDRATMYTNGDTTIWFCVETGIEFLDSICQHKTIAIPSLWGDAGILNGVSPFLGDDIASLLAAYLTIGEPESMDYMQALLYHVMCQIITTERDVVGAEGVYPAPLFYHFILSGLLSAEWHTGEDEKAFIAPLPEDNFYDRTYVPPARSCFNWLCTEYIEIIRLVGAIYGNSMQIGIGQSFSNWFSGGSNGFPPGYATWFGADGDFNADGIPNKVSYANVDGDRALWFINEGLITPERDGELEGEANGSVPGDSIVGCRNKLAPEKGLPFLGDWLLIGVALLAVKHMSFIPKP